MDFIPLPGAGATVAVPPSGGTVSMETAPIDGSAAGSISLGAQDTVAVAPAFGAGAGAGAGTVSVPDSVPMMSTIPMSGGAMDTIPMPGGMSVVPDTIQLPGAMAVVDDASMSMGGGGGMSTIPMSGAGMAIVSDTAPVVSDTAAVVRSEPVKRARTSHGDESKTSGGRRRITATHDNDSSTANDYDYDYEMVVIGGGSAGLAAAKRTLESGHSCLLLDYVKPSPQGTKWGLGGTCVNVGCIPKKLFHTAALYGEVRHASTDYGWSEADREHSWDKLMNKVKTYIIGLNSSYQSEMAEAGVEYKNRLGSFVDPHTVRLTDSYGRTKDVTARRVLIAVGGRPTPIPCEGGELAISSDDVFTLDRDPGKTLVVGASYVALECAGFLAGTGHDTTVMVRSIFLRGFDQDIANKIAEHMKTTGVNFIRPATPSKIERQEDGKLKVTWRMKDGSEGSDVYDTVLAAIGRRADTAGLNLEAAGVEVASNGKIPAVNEQTNVPHIYAVGDVLHGRLELTPVAIQAAKLLVDRLYRKSKVAMDYELVPTTVFTPLEYGACGLSEEDAIARYGIDAIEIYHTNFQPLEWSLTSSRTRDKGYCKLVCRLDDDLRVVGLHYLGPNAGEVTQGFATALRLGATYEDIYATVGIHPTTAEKFTTLTATRRNGESVDGGGC